MKVRQLLSALKRAKKNADVYMFDGEKIVRPVFAFSSCFNGHENAVNKHDNEFWLQLTQTDYPDSNTSREFKILGVTSEPKLPPNVTVIGPSTNRTKPSRHQRHHPVPAVRQQTSWTILDRALTRMKAEKDIPDGPVVHERGKML